MKEIYINTEGSKVSAYEWGEVEKPTSLSFIELGYLLQTRYHIISIDLPGHGKNIPFLEEKVMKCLI